MKQKFLCFFVLIFLTGSWAEKQTYVQSASQIVGSNQSVNEVRPIALLEAKRLALEQAGTYVESITVSEDFEITKDEVLSLTAGMVETKVIDEKIETVSGAIKFTITIEAVIELADLEARIQELKQQGSNDNTLEENKALRDQNAELERQLREMQAQLEKARSEEEARRIQEESQALLRQAKSREEMDKARNLMRKGRRDPKQYVEAEKILKDVAQNDPNSAMPDYYLQQIASKQNRSLGAQIQLLENALKKNPELHLARLELGRLNAQVYKLNKQQRFYQGAVNNLKLYIQVMPQNPKGYILLADIYSLTAQTQLERQTLQDCVKNVPDSPSHQNDMMVVKQKLGIAGTTPNPRDPKNHKNPPDKLPPNNNTENNNPKLPANVRLVDPPAIATAKVSIQHRNYKQAIQILSGAISPLEVNLAKNPNNAQACRDLARLYSTQAVTYGFLANLQSVASSYQKATHYWGQMGTPHQNDLPLIAGDYYQLAHTYATMVQQNPAFGTKHHQEKIKDAVKGALEHGYNRAIIQSHPTLRNYL